MVVKVNGQRIDSASRIEIKEEASTLKGLAVVLVGIIAALIWLGLF